MTASTDSDTDRSETDTPPPQHLQQPLEHTADELRTLAASLEPGTPDLAAELAKIDFAPLEQARARAEAQDRQRELRKAVAHLDTRLQSLERTQAGLVMRIDELTAATLLHATIAETLDDLRRDGHNLRDALRATHELADRIDTGVGILEAKSSIRSEIRFFGVAVLLLALAIAATGNFLLGTLGERPRAQGLRPPLADAPPPRYPPPLELTPAPSRLSPLPP